MYTVFHLIYFSDKNVEVRSNLELSLRVMHLNFFSQNNLLMQQSDLNFHGFVHIFPINYFLKF